MLLALGIAWIALVLSYLSSLPLFGYVGPSSYVMSQIGGLSVFLTVAIPLLGMMLLITRWFSNYRIPEEWRARLRLTWVVAFAIAAFSAFNLGNSYQHRSEYSSVEEYNIPNDVIQLEANQTKEYTNSFGVHMSHLVYNRQGMFCDDVHYEIHKSDDDQLKVETIVKSNGENKEVSEKLIDQVNANFTYKDGVFELPNAFKIKKGSKYRGQSITIKIMVPENQEIKMSSRIGRGLNNSPFVGNRHRPKNYMDYTWKMTENGLHSEDWDKEYKAEKIIESDKLANINIEGKINATIMFGDKNEIKLKGPKVDIDKIESVITDDATSLILQEWVNDDVEIIVTTPQLDILHAKNVRSMKIEGFKQKKMEINYVNGSNLKAYIDVEDLSCTLNSYSTHTFIGSGKKLTINSDNSPKVIAEQFKVDHVQVYGQLSGRSSFYAAELFETEHHRHHNYTILGNPEIVGDIQNAASEEKADAGEMNTEQPGNEVSREVEEERSALESELKAVKEEIEANAAEVKEEIKKAIEEVKENN